MSASNLDALFKQYREASADQKEAARDRLIRAMLQNGYAIVWHRLKNNYPHIVGDSVAQAARYMDSFRGDAQFSTWFYAIVRNFCNSELRHKLTRKEISLEQYTEETGEIECPRPVEDAKTDLAWLVGSLEAPDQQFVEMKLAGLSHPEIADKLGITVKAADSRWFRLKEKLLARAQDERADESLLLS